MISRPDERYARLQLELQRTDALILDLHARIRDDLRLALRHLARGEAEAAAALLAHADRIVALLERLLEPEAPGVRDLASLYAAARAALATGEPAELTAVADAMATLYDAWSET